jgi:hypothetical protein
VLVLLFFSPWFGFLLCPFISSLSACSSERRSGSLNIQGRAGTFEPSSPKLQKGAPKSFLRIMPVQKHPWAICRDSNSCLEIVLMAWLVAGRIIATCTISATTECKNMKVY